MFTFDETIFKANIFTRMWNTLLELIESISMKLYFDLHVNIKSIIDYLEFDWIFY